VAEGSGLAENAIILRKSRIITHLVEEAGDFFW